MSKTDISSGEVKNPLILGEGASEGTGEETSEVEDRRDLYCITPTSAFSSVQKYGAILLLTAGIVLLVVLLYKKSSSGNNSNEDSNVVDCTPAPFYEDSLQQTCGAQMNVRAPNNFSIIFDTTLGPFSADCVRNRAPAQVDRLYNLAQNGYYDNNYFFRVVNTTTRKISQFGTNGIPAVSNIYNFMSPALGDCAIVLPQPPNMAINVGGTQGLSNTYGTISMSTSYNETTNTTWNATAELFINTGNNSDLDAMLFVPLCTVSDADMEAVVMQFPSVGEVQELGGDGVSIDELYAEGNLYIENNPDWGNMTKTNVVRVTCLDDGTYNANVTCGPCTPTATSSSSSSGSDGMGTSTCSVPYERFTNSAWECPNLYTNTCAL